MADSPQRRNAQTKRSQGKQPSNEEQQAAAEKARHDRKVQTIIGAVAVVAIVVILGVIAFVIYWTTRPAPPVDASALKADVDNVKVKPTDMTDNYGFLISKDGLNKPVKDAPTIDVYMDFICPACGTVDQALDETWLTMVTAGQINIVIHPMAFLDRSSSDQYSTRAASMAIYIAQNDPDHLLKFIQAMFDSSFQPQEATNYKPTSDQDIADLAVKAGVDQSVATAAMKETFKPWVTALSSWTPTQKNLQHPVQVSSDSSDLQDEMTTPTIMVNGTMWDFATALGSGQPSDLPAVFCTAIGLKTDDIGNPTVLPQIGATGQAITAAAAK